MPATRAGPRIERDVTGELRIHRFAAAAVVSLAATAAFADAAPTVALLKSKSIAAYDEAERAFVAALGAPVARFDLAGRLENGPAVAERIRALKPAVVVAIGVKAARAARAHLPHTPLVYCLVMHPQQFGLSGDRVAGVPLRVPAGDQLAALRQIAPRVVRVGLLASVRTHPAIIAEATEAARAVGATLVIARVGGPREVLRATERLLPRVHALWLLPDASVVTGKSFRFLLLKCFRRGIPVLAFARSFVRKGALLALWPDYAAMGRAAAGLVRRLLDGKPPSGGQAAPPPPRLTLNATTARRLRLRIPPALARGAEVLE